MWDQALTKLPAVFGAEPLWKYGLVFAVFFAICVYLTIDRLKNGPYSDLMKWTLVLRLYQLPDELNEHPPESYLVAPPGRITSIEVPWFTLTFDRPWVMWLGELKQVRIKKLVWWVTMNDIGIKPLGVIVDPIVGHEFKGSVSIKYL